MFHSKGMDLGLLNLQMFLGISPFKDKVAIQYLVLFRIPISPDSRLCLIHLKAGEET
jgi:hypothetical protein